jgi:hypothetical protein
MHSVVGMREVQDALDTLYQEGEEFLGKVRAAKKLVDDSGPRNVAAYRAQEAVDHAAITLDKVYEVIRAMEE